MIKINRSVTANTAINDEYNNKIENFVDNMKESIEYYARKRNASPANIRRNIALSKKTELLARHFVLEDECFNALGEANEIDFEIRNSWQKKWVPDLILGNTPIHIKSCDDYTLEYLNQEYTWTFQIKNTSDNYGRDVLFNKKHKNDLCFFMFMHDWKDDAAIIKIISQFNEVEPLLRNPLKHKYFGIKKCLYYNDIRQ